MSATPSSYADTAWAILTDGRATERAERGALIYAPDHVADHLYVLQSGAVSLQLRSGEGRALTLRIVEAGQLFGHAGAGDDKIGRASCRERV